MQQLNGQSVDEIRHNYKLVIAAIVFICIGIISILAGYFSNRASPGNIRAFLFLNLGSLSTIGAAYNLVSELYLKRNFADQIRKSIDCKLERLSFDESISTFGLHSIQEVYSKEKLLARMSSSSSVLMIVMRSHGFFSHYCPEIREFITNNNLYLTVIMLDPESQVMSLLGSRFANMTQERLIETSGMVINGLIKDEIHDRLDEEFRGNIELRLSDRYPVYSCYLFDDEEIWLIPYFFRSERRPVPVFVFKGRELIRRNEIYKDIMAMLKDISIPRDLSNKV